MSFSFVSFFGETRWTITNMISVMFFETSMKKFKEKSTLFCPRDETSALLSEAGIFFSVILFYFVWLCDTLSL